MAAAWAAALRHEQFGGERMEKTKTFESSSNANRKDKMTEMPAADTDTSILHTATIAAVTAHQLMQILASKVRCVRFGLSFHEERF